MGSIKTNRLLKMGPFIKSMFRLKNDFFAGDWVIGFSFFAHKRELLHTTAPFKHFI